MEGQEGALVVACAAVCFTTAAGIYRFVRPKFPITVNCHFCGQDAKVPYGNRSCWDCPYCEQYNGFTMDGDYNKPIPAQFIEDLNHPVSIENKSPGGESLSSNALCEECNRSQSIKIRQLANFVPENEESFDYEVENYRQYLDRIYRPCPTCEYKLQSELQKQDLILSKKLDKYFREQRQKDTNEVSSTTSFYNDAPVRPNAGRILGLDIIAVCQAILLLLSCLDVSQQHAVFSQKLYNLLVSGVSLLQMFGVILPLLGGTVQGLSICLAGHSRLKTCDTLCMLCWCLSTLLHTKSLENALDRNILWLLKGTLALTGAALSLTVLRTHMLDPTSPRKMIKQYKLNTPNSSLNESFHDESIPDDIEPQSSPVNINSSDSDDFAALETISIGTASRNVAKHLVAFGQFGDTAVLNQNTQTPPATPTNLHHRRHNRVILSPARFKPSSSSSQFTHRPFTQAQLAEPGRPNMGPASHQGRTWTSLGSLPRNQASSFLARAAGPRLDNDRASLFSEPRAPTVNDSNSTSDHDSSSRNSEDCPVGSTVPDQPVSPALQHSSSEYRNRTSKRRFAKTSLILAISILTFAVIFAYFVSSKYYRDVIDFYQRILMPS